MIFWAFTVVLSLAAPLLLLPLEKLFPFPHFIEEGMKLLFVVLIYKGEILERLQKSPLSDQKPFPGWLIALSAGFLFTLSETMLYSLNFFAIGNFSGVIPRLLQTGALHIGTTLCLYFLGKKHTHETTQSTEKIGRSLWGIIYIKGITIALIGSIWLHAVFNMWAMYR